MIATLSASEWIAVIGIASPILLGLIAWATKMHSRMGTVETDMTNLKSDMKEVRSDQSKFRDTLARIETRIEVGFATLGEQIKTLFKDNEEKH